MVFPLPTLTASTPLELNCSRQFLNWLQAQQISLAFTTYQTNRLFLLGVKPNGELSTFERLFDRAMGLYATSERLYLSSRYQLWQLDNALEPGEVRDGYDRVYIPRIGYTTGDLDIHDIAVATPDGGGTDGHPVIVNTLFSCLATVSDRYSFKPLWQPPFISKLAAEDRCHLNGLAMVEGKPRYVTAVSRADVAAGWRERRQDGGIVMDVQLNEVVAANLSMPHSPRFYQGKLWLLNSGTGEFGYVDLERGTFEAIAFCPGYGRGMAFHGNYAIVGLSKPRHNKAFSGLALNEQLAAKNADARCGLMVIDLHTGDIAHWLFLEGVVEELYDVQVLPGVRQPMALGFKTDEIAQFITIEAETQPSADGVRNPSLLIAPRHSTAVQYEVNPIIAEVKYQVSNLDAATSIQYDAFTFPSIKKRWQTFVPQGPLVAVTATIFGQIVGAAIAEIRPETVLPLTPAPPPIAELLSLFVTPAHRRQGIGTNLIENLEKALAERDCRVVELTYQTSELSASALEPLLRKHWEPPQTQMLLSKTTIDRIAQADWLYKYSLPDTFTIFPWADLTQSERQNIQQQQWYPDSLNPFGNDPRVEPLNSLGLRYQDEVVGWMVTHRVAPDTIRYSTLFVQANFQRLGRAIPLLAESIKRQIASQVRYCTFAVAMENQSMLRFVNRRLSPYQTFFAESRKSLKHLNSDGQRHKSSVQ